MHLKQVLLPGSVLCTLLLLTSTSMHNERVGEITFEEYNNEVYARAVLDKRYLVLALKQEADCPAAAMMANCAPNYVKDHLSVQLNGKPVDMRKIQQELTQRHLIITWKLNNQEPVEQLRVNSTYMLALTNHATLGINCHLNQQERYYTMSARKSSINVSY